jgi:glycosyltransferase involved in cell wall biosynthesis
MQAKSITGFFPAYNDAGSIRELVRSADAVLRELTDDYELLVVDDGSQDETAAILRALEVEVPRLRVISHPENRGYGGALRSGFSGATKELVFYTDGDGQYDPAELRQLFAALSDSVDVVQGFKRTRQDPLHRVIIGRVYRRLVKLAFGLGVRDVDCDFRLIRRRVFEQVRLEFDSGVICVELVKKIEQAGFTIAEVPVSHYPRQHGQSQFFRFDRIYQTGRDLLRLWWTLARASRFAGVEPHAVV